MRNLLPLLIGVTVVAMVIAIAMQVPSGEQTHRHVVPKSNSTSYDGPGFGITFTGKPGIEVMPGIVMGYDGSIGPGF